MSIPTSNSASRPVYGREWNDPMRFMIDSVGAEEARDRYRNGPWFSVAVGLDLATSAEQSRSAAAAGISLPIPEFSLELEPNASAVNTFFYDPHGSIIVIYAFHRHDEKTLFLHNTTFYTYPDPPRYYGQSESVAIHSIKFHLDGTSRERINDLSQPMIQIIDRKDVNLTKNWEPLPTFGDWASLGRANRNDPDWHPKKPTPTSPDQD